MRLRTMAIAVGSALTGAVLLAAGTAAAIIISTDLNEYRGVLAERIEAVTGRPLTVRGDVGLAFSLTPTVVIGDASLANAGWGTRPDMATIERLEAQFGLMPLLFGRIEVRRLVLDGADILLETDPAGNGNWLFGEADVASNAAGNGAASPLPSFGDVVVERSTLRYRDGAAGTEWVVRVDRLTAHPEAGDDRIALALEGAFNALPLLLSGSVGALDLLHQGSPYPIDLRSRIGTTTLTARGVIPQVIATAGLPALSLTAVGESLAELGPLFGTTLPPVGPYDFAVTLADSGDAYRIAARIGGSDLSGSVKATLGAPRPRFDGSFTSTRLDLRDLGVDSRDDTDQPDDGRLFSAEPLPLDLLSAIDGHVTFAGQQVVRNSATLHDVRLELDLTDGRLSLAPFAAKLAGGSVSVSGTIDVAPPSPAVAVAASAQDVEADLLLGALGLGAVIGGGKANLALDLQGSGASLRSIMAGLGGDASLEMAGGRINNGFARILLANLGELVSTGGTGGTSRLSCLVSRFHVVDGVATSRGLVLDTPGATIFGTGVIRLEPETIDMRFEPSAKQGSLAALAVPVHVHGPLVDPNVTADPVAVATSVAGNTAAIAAEGAFGLLAAATGVNVAGDSGGGNPCVIALEPPAGDAAPAKQKKKSTASAGEQILDDTGSTIGDIGRSIGNLLGSGRSSSEAGVPNRAGNNK